MTDNRRQDARMGLRYLCSCCPERRGLGRLDIDNLASRSMIRRLQSHVAVRQWSSCFRKVQRHCVRVCVSACLRPRCACTYGACRISLRIYLDHVERGRIAARQRIAGRAVPTAQGAYSHTPDTLCEVHMRSSGDIDTRRCHDDARPASYPRLKARLGAVANESRNPSTASTRTASKREARREAEKKKA
ncbi:hypothetical protein V8C44DRAFT_163682 [Trichoderma aethiopicum]